MDPLDLIVRTGGAAFATDEQNRVIIWNKAAERLLRYPAAAVLGKPCQDIVCGVDVFGNRFCDRPCALHHMVRRKEPVQHFEMEMRKESGERFTAGVTVVVVPGQKAGHYSVVHFLQPIDHQRDVNMLIRRILSDTSVPPVDSAAATQAPAAPAVPLTARELQVLRMLADGTSTQEIADALFISVTTTRNHVQSVLRKLEVHSKLEAVSLALRRHLF